MNLLAFKKDLKSSKPLSQKGFSLLEVMIALMVFVVLMIVTVNVVKNTREYDHLLENQHYMNEVKNALITFVKVNGFLPCPDTDGDGKENREGAPDFECTFARGTIPFLELGVPATDVWHQPLLYAVNTRSDAVGTELEINQPLNSAAYFNSGDVPALGAAPVFEWNTLPIGENRAGAGNLRVCAEIATDCSATTGGNDLLERAAIAVVVSFGQNGHATWNAINTNASGASIGLDDAEIENMDGDMNYWQAIGSQREDQKFDDHLFWLVGTEIKYAIVSSGGTL